LTGPKEFAVNKRKDIRLIDARDCRLANALDWGAMHSLEQHDNNTDDGVRREQLAILGTTMAFLILVAGSLAALSRFA
jgi:hypothetical protein